MNKLGVYFSRYAVKATQGDPIAISALVALGLIAAGKYVYDKIKE